MCCKEVNIAECNHKYDGRVSYNGHQVCLIHLNFTQKIIFFLPVYLLHYAHIITFQRSLISAYLFLYLDLVFS